MFERAFKLADRNTVLVKTEDEGITLEFEFPYDVNWLSLSIDEACELVAALVGAIYSLKAPAEE